MVFSGSAPVAKQADEFLPAKFTRAHDDKAHAFERDGDAWRIDGKGPMTLRQAMASLLGEEPAKHRSFIQCERNQEGNMEQAKHTAKGFREITDDLIAELIALAPLSSPLLTVLRDCPAPNEYSDLENFIAELWDWRERLAKILNEQS